MRILPKIAGRLRRYIPPRLKLHLDRRQEYRKDSVDSQKFNLLKELNENLDNYQTIEEMLSFSRVHFSINQKDSEILSLLDKLQEIHPVTVGEIGTFRCGNLFLLSNTICSIHKIIAVDMLFRNKGLFNSLRNKVTDITFIEGFSTSTRTVKNVGKALGNSKFDFLFIDGDHSYDGVKSDFLNYRKFVKNGGLVAFHDIVEDMTTRMKSPVPLSKAISGGVPRFWAEVKDFYPSEEFIDDPGQDGFGIGLIEYTDEVNYS